MKRYKISFSDGSWHVHDREMNLRGMGESLSKAFLMLVWWQGYRFAKEESAGVNKQSYRAAARMWEGA